MSPQPRLNIDVEVLVGETWHPGVLRRWEHRPDGWWGNVAWTETPGSNRLDAFPAERMREVRYCPWWRGRRECLGWVGCEEPVDP